METIGIVKTAYGLVQGVELTGKYAGITQFRGIPFAKPPVGDLRWKPPVDPDGWSGIRFCDSYAPVCVQPTDGHLDAEPWGSDFYFMGNPPQSEDCLYLNITTPAKSADEKLPVYVWFHGGSSDHGYTYEVEFNPRELAKKGIVVVSVAQRLSMFGYLALPQLDAEQGGHSGNYILMDDHKALEWIIANIGAFGGDNCEITLGGQSAGTRKSSMLAYGPIEPGHVKRIINESALKWNLEFTSREEAERECADFLRLLGIDPELSPEELRRIDARRLIPASSKATITPGPLIYDGYWVPHKNLGETIREKGYPYDYLIGSNLGESHMTASDLGGVYGIRSTAEFYRTAREMLGDLYDKYDFENLVKVEEKNVDRMSRRLASLGLSLAQRMGSITTNLRFGQVRDQKSPDQNTYVYLFSRVPPHRQEDLGTMRDPELQMSWHSSELWYTFNSLRRGIPPARPWENRDFELAETMCDYWANFIKTGDPNGPDLPLWPSTGEQGNYIELGDDIQIFDNSGKLDALIREYLEGLGAFPE